MTNDLRGALHALAPEPPEHLGLPETARRRARHIRRRRYVAATTFVAVAGLVVAAATVLPGREAIRPTGGAAYPDWPRRGDAPPSADAEAIDEYDAYLSRVPGRPRRNGDAQVLYSGSDGVVALRVVPTVGGRRIVVLARGDDGRFVVESDAPDVRGGARTLVVAVGLSPVPPQARPCDPEPAMLRPVAVRLLVLGPPSLDEPMRWEAGPPEDCVDAVGFGDPHEFDLRDGAAVVDVMIAPARTLYVRVGGAGGDVLLLSPPTLRPYHGVRVVGDVRRPPLGWLDRDDSSVADTLEVEVANSDHDLEPYAGRCLVIWSAALPDGTETAVCTGVNPGDGRPVALLSRAGDELRLHHEVAPQKPVSVFAAVVTGAQRWLLVVGPETLAEAELVDGSRRTPIPLVNGSGWLALDSDLSPDARVWTPDFARSGGAGIDRDHEVLTVHPPRRL